MQEAGVISWTLVYEGFEPSKESLREALCTLGNGYFATWGGGAGMGYFLSKISLIFFTNSCILNGF